MSPNKLVFDIACYCPIKIDKKTYWAIKQLNMNIDETIKAKLL